LLVLQMYASAFMDTTIGLQGRLYLSKTQYVLCRNCAICVDVVHRGTLI